jgi:2-oxoacid:acceptor oxidoreductase gamma subunit (pyruvate/2-ketoisovalerate family)/2-oxoacid:acceptor oxidoreductase delta subunit (pyruvate/2-ketoisovalerate family)
MEIRLHGRGGQGGVTCAKIIASTYARLGKQVQAFGDYAGERSGAPVRAYTRVSDAEITNRNKVYEPDHLVVLDPHLLGSATVAGLKPGGALLVNSDADPESFDGRYQEFLLATVDATSIARRHGIGTRSVVIVNTTLGGAFAKVHGIPLDVLQETYRALGLASNFEAAREAFEAVSVRPARDVEREPASEPPAAVPAPVQPLTEHRSSPPTGLRTGSWSSQRPSYVQHLAPCNAWCPAGNDVVGFVQAVASDGEGPAAEILGTTTPLAAVCGRVCPAPCMEGCNRAEYDGAVNIRGLERWISDRVPVAPREVTRRPDARSIAIVGGGPAGLSAAYALALEGHAATIFEAEHELGGVLATGIPAYRLPREVVRREVEDVLALGVEARTGEHITTARLLQLAGDHDAVILATGLQRPRALSAPGAELAGVEQGLRFLHRVNVGGGAELTGHVVVLGGGNTAVDCARSALRAGADRVTLAYRRTRAEMPAIREEIDEALAEGIELRLLRQPVALRGEERVTAVELAEVELGEPDDTGRRSPIVTDRTEHLACDAVLLALGQSADLSFMPDGWVLEDGRFHRDGRELFVFAAGDVATGDGTVTHAIGNGRRVAGLALSALGLDVEVFERPARESAVPVTDIRLDHFGSLAPSRDVLAPAESRAAGFEEVNSGIASGLEAHRCFSCGHCTRCDTCLVYCPEGIVRRDEGDYEVDYSYCKGCGICVEECPRSAMEMSTS